MTAQVGALATCVFMPRPPSLGEMTARQRVRLVLVRVCPRVRVGGGGRRGRDCHGHP
jgi:hypothetical protein